MSDLEQALQLLRTRPEIANDLLIMAGARQKPSDDFPTPVLKIEASMRNEMLGSEQELFMVFAIDNSGELIDEAVLFKGFDNMVVTSPRVIFRWLLTRDRPVGSFYVAHNHPVGLPEPSSADIDMTEHLLKLSIFQDIPLNDHFILGQGGEIKSVRKIVERNLAFFGNTKEPDHTEMLRNILSAVEKMGPPLKQAVRLFESNGPDLWKWK